MGALSRPPRAAVFPILSIAPLEKSSVLRLFLAALAGGVVVILFIRIAALAPHCGETPMRTITIGQVIKLAGC